MRDNDDSFDPENDIRDYDQVAKTLPVYCVSSRAYQKLQGRLQIDENIQGFPDAADTGIPQLQKHVRELTESGRVVHYCRFLEDFSHLLNYLSLWSKDHSGEVKLSEGEKRDEVTRVLGELKTLCKVSHLIGFLANRADCKQALNTVSLSTANDCRNVLTHRLYGRFDAAIEVASEAAIRTAEAWFAPKSAGGFPWNTFRATCIREYVFDMTLSFSKY